MTRLPHLPSPSRVASAAVALACGLLLTALSLGCHSGTPAAPEGTVISLGCEFVSRDVSTGNFEAIIRAVVMDDESDVPQVAVGVYFRVKSGPGEMSDEGPVVTNNDGVAQSVLIGRGATENNEVTVEVSSGPVKSEITMDVLGCFSASSSPPVLEFTVSPSTSTIRETQVVTVDLSDSTDSDCPGGKPTSWRVRWGDGQSSSDDFADEDQATHDYAQDFVPNPPGNISVTIQMEVTDCQGLTDSGSYQFTLQR